MYFVLTVVSIFLGVGCFLKYLLNLLSLKNSIYSRNSPHTKSSNFAGFCSFFDPFQVHIFKNTNVALESIFNIIVESYILSWYRTLSDNIDFIVQVRLHLQHLSAVLINRSKSINPTDFLVNCVVKSLLNHVGHIYPLLSAGKHAEPMLEETVLRDLVSHLHICLSSRSAELAYLRSVVNRLLPYIALPPGLIFSIVDQHETISFTDFQSFKTHLLSPKRNASFSSYEFNRVNEEKLLRSSSASTLAPRSTTPVTLGTNPAAYSFLIEILSTCVLLPAMDAVANPDFINRIILECLTESMPKNPANDLPNEVRVLNCYVDEWERWIAEKPQCKIRLEKLINQPEDCFSLVQYMKSVKSTVPITTVLLMHEIDQRVRTGPLLPDACREIKAQIQHILHLIRYSTSNTSDSDTFVDTAEHFVVPQTLSHSRLFDLPEAFEKLLLRYLENPTLANTLRLIESPVWTNGCRKAYEAVEQRFLPLFMESPECLVQLYGVSLRLSSTFANSPSYSPQRTSQSSSIFSFPLNIFSNNVVEGRVLSDPDAEFSRTSVQLPNRSQRGQTGRNANFHWTTSNLFDQSNALTIDSQHQLHSHYLIHNRHQIDMSTWHVFIPGLSRPEIRPSRRLIDQLVTPGGGSSLTNNNTNIMTKSLDGALRDKAWNESSKTVLFPLNDARTPHLSPQFLFTVRTEQLVNGTWQPIARVDRKYAEFYVLEQKLSEFHGNAIVRQLPRKQFIPRTFEFLETKREPFEDYLQYLISQPFLRNSELLHGFLTSSATFSSSVLSDLNLGRFAKSVPLKLIRERGQYLDNFLVTFYLSCNPQPIALEPHTPEPSILPSTTVFVGPGVSPLGGIDTLATPNQYRLGLTTDGTTRTRSTESRGSTPPTVKQTVSRPNAVAPVERRGPKLTWLDNRLRIKMFWNNAGLTRARWIEVQNTCCDFEAIKFDGIIEIPLFLLKYLVEPVASFSDDPQTADESPKPVCDSLPSETQPPGSVTASNNMWDISHEFWNEALLNGPTSIHTCQGLVSHVSPPPVPLERTQLPSISPDPPCAKTLDPVLNDRENRDVISIGLLEVILAFRTMVDVIKQHLLVRARQFSLWVLYTLHHVFQSQVDRCLSRLIERYLRDTVITDQFMSTGLQLLKTTLFHQYVPSSEQEKTERKTQARIALKQFVSGSKLAFLLDPKTLDESLDRLFTCFQHPKWNKQLSYVLFDQLLITLFPELCTHPADPVISDN